MAIFSKKTEDEAKEVKADGKAVEAGELTVAETGAVTVKTSRKSVLALPRLSEKASALSRLNKYVFKVSGGKANKIELRKAIEKFYGVKVASINTVSVQGKYRRYGRTYGKTSNFKKAIVTLTPDSKQPDIEQAA